MKDGYTPIANEVLDKLLTVHLSANQWQVLLCIIRKTYGFHKKVDHIANSQIVKSTGLCKAVVSRCLKELNDRQLLIRKGKFIGFQKDWEQWEKLAKLQTPVDEKLVPSTSQKLAILSTSQKLAILSPKVSSPAVPPFPPHPPIPLTKETIQKKGYKSIFDFWNEQKIQVHRTLTQDMRSVIVRTLRSYSVEETCKAIANYAEILHGQEYYWTYKWTLVDFLKRGLVKFMDLEVARANYRGDGGKDGKAKLSRAYKSADDHYGRSKTA